jgi:hypothetical protein
MKKQLTTLVLLSLLALAARPEPAAACSCAMPPAPIEALERASAVFRGRVTAIEPPALGPSVRLGMTRSARFAVDTAWRGPVTPEMTVATMLDTAACGYPFAVGQDYLVYADAAADALIVTICSRTRPTDEAQADLSALGPGNPVSADPGPGS